MTFQSSYITLDELRDAARKQGLDVDKEFRGIYDQDGNLVASFNLSVLNEVTNVKAV